MIHALVSAGNQPGYGGNESGYGGRQSGYGGNQVGYPHQGHPQGHPQGQHGSHGSSGPAQSVGMANQEGGMDRQLGTHYQSHGGQHHQQQPQQQQPGGYQWGQGLGSGFGTGFHDSQVSSAPSHHHCCCCGEVSKATAGYHTAMVDDLVFDAAGVLHRAKTSFGTEAAVATLLCLGEQRSSCVATAADVQRQSSVYKNTTILCCEAQNPRAGGQLIEGCIPTCKHTPQAEAVGSACFLVCAVLHDSVQFQAWYGVACHS